MYIRIYTDSQYSRNTLLAASSKSKHFYLIESIKALGSKLRYDNNSEVTIHWIPSHIEQTILGRRPIHGNCKADKLAEEARKRSSSCSTYRQISCQRKKLQTAISRSLTEIEKLFKPQEENSDGPSPCDDFDNDASKENASTSFDT